MHVAAILKEKGRAVETVTDAVTLAEVARRLANHRIGAVVVRGARGELAGIVSERDIVHAIADRGAAVLEWPVAKIMTRDVVTAREADTIDDIMIRMTESRFRHLPVVEGSELVGIVSIGDVVKHRVAEVELEASAMRDYISAAV